MKKQTLSILCCTVFCMTMCVQTSAAPVQNLANAIASVDAAQSVTQSSETLWQQYYEAEANKKLLELKTQPLHEQIKWAEQMGDYTQWLEYKQQEYNAKSQKEQYEFQKKQAEYQLTLLGEIQKPHQRIYAWYEEGNAAWEDTSLEELQLQKETLRMQEEKLELEKKTLEYTYRLGEVGDDAFLTQYQDILQQKQYVKEQRENIEAQSQLLTKWTGPDMGPAGGLLP